MGREPALTSSARPPHRAFDEVAYQKLGSVPVGDILQNAHTAFELDMILVARNMRAAPADAELTFQQWWKDAHWLATFDVFRYVVLPLIGPIQGATAGPVAERRKAVVEALRGRLSRRPR